MSTPATSPRRALQRHDVRVTPVRADALPGPARDVLEDWGRLARISPLPSADPGWSLAALEGLHPGRTLRLVTVHRGGRLVGACPLVASADGRSLEQPGVSAFYEPTEVLAADPAALQALAAALTHQRCPVVLGRLLADGPTVPALRAAARGRGPLTVGEGAGAPRIALDPGWEDPVSRLSASRRSDLRRAQRRAEALGPVRLDSSLPAASALRPLLDEAIAVEAAGWKGRAGTALAVAEDQRRAFTAFARHAATQRRLRVSFLRIGDRAAAMQVAVEHDDALWVLKTGFDEEFARCSPGMLVTAGTIAEAARRGLRAYELQGCPEAWTRVFTTDERPTVAARFYPARPRALARWAGDRARVVRGRLREERGA